MIVPRFNLGRLGLSLLLEGQIDFLKARSIRGNITIEQTTTMEASSRIRNVVTIRPLSISSELMPEKVHWVAKLRPPSSPKVEEQDAQPLHAAGTPQCVCFARAPGGIPALSGPHLRLDGGTTDMRCGRWYKLIGSPAKNWSKLLTHRSFAGRNRPSLL